MRACTKCKIVKPFEDFHRNKTKRSGINSECRECKNARRAFERASKRCTKCKERKLLSEFTIDRVKKDGLTTRCRPCRNKLRTVSTARRSTLAEERRAIAPRRVLFAAIPAKRPEPVKPAVVHDLASLPPDTRRKFLERMSRYEREQLPGYAAPPPLKASDGRRLDEAKPGLG